jgi:hypothetical protein
VSEAAKSRLKAIEESALAVARSAREMLVREGLDDDEGRHQKPALVLHLLETRGPLRLRDLAEAMSKSLKLTNYYVRSLLERGRIERVRRGVYRAIPRERRLPKAELPVRPKRKRAPRKRRVKSALERLGEM